jgi:hypothetical protein
MKLINKILRVPVAPPLLAIFERLDSIDTQFDDMYQPILTMAEEFDFGPYQNWLLAREFRRIAKCDAYRACMTTLLNNKVDRIKIVLKRK